MQNFNLSTILIAMALLALVFLAVRHLYQQHKQGKCVGCDQAKCEHCGMHCNQAQHMKK